jgi:uncharacterized 2Fe-2S/4Fe-4S cluster protein (DUF4445 family)
MIISSTKRHIALDLGTTTLAGRLLAPTGEVLAEKQIVNPQHKYGADILMRLQNAHDGDGKELQSLLVSGLRSLVAELVDWADCIPDDITSVAAAGNPGMSCLLRNLPVSSLLFPPHKPPYKALARISDDEIDLGFLSPLELFPLASGFVGGDLVAVLLGVEMLTCAARVDSLNRFSSSTVQRFNNSTVLPGTLLIDIGTNAELALWDGERWWVTSAAAGPAFEGGNIGTGMIMADGAVTDIRLPEDRLQLVVAGGGQPRGLCGSGLAALVAVARQAGLIDTTGRILAADEVETNLNRYLVKHEGLWAILFHRDSTGELLLTQDDLRNFQLAKGAVRAGTQVLLEMGGFAPEDVSQVLVTGALGTALPVEILKRVALLPEPMLDKTSFIANGVLAGLQAYLTATDGQQRLADLMNTIQPFPLSGTPAFERFFLAALDFESKAN